MKRRIDLSVIVACYNERILPEYFLMAKFWKIKKL